MVTKWFVSILSGKQDNLIIVLRWSRSYMRYFFVACALFLKELYFSSHKLNLQKDPVE